MNLVELYVQGRLLCRVEFVKFYNLFIASCKLEFMDKLRSVKKM